MSRALEVAMETPWAMTEGHLATLLEIAARRLDDEIEVELSCDGGPEAVEVRTGDQIEGARRATVRDGVAVVPVVGPIFRRANLFTEVSGATSVELLARDLQAAIESPDVEAVLLDVDSPGGAVNGISEMSDLIFEARDELPVRAFVSGAGASGAYWLASSAEDVVAADTALLGSIGVRMVVTDTTERDRKEGIRRIEFVSSQSPRKSLDPTSEEGQADLQRIVDTLADVFVDAVARNRGVTVETVLRDFGQGSVFVGREAVTRGMADRIGTFEGTLAALQERISAGDGMSLAAKQEDGTMSEDNEDRDVELDDLELSAEEVREHFPEASEAIAADGREQERDRILAIFDLDVPDAYQELIAEAVSDPDATADSVSRKILDRQSEKRKAALEARKEDEEGLDAPEPDAGGDEEADASDKRFRELLEAGESAGIDHRVA